MSQLRDLVAAELRHPVSPQVSAMAAAIAARHGAASRAVLFYGSCLREQQLDGLMLDFYLIVADYRSAYGKRWLAAANRVLPPNVFPFEHGGLRAKYAVLSEADFHRLNGPETRSVSVWARFAQPSRLVWSSDIAAEARAVAAVARAAPTLLSAALASLPNDQPPLELWRAAFALTYSAELRAEKKGRAGSVVDADPERYRRFTAPALAAARAESRRRHAGWPRRRVEGKALSVLRLAKATATYAGGADYIVWKINRHAGTDFQLKPWQRRWPILAALTLAPRLLKSKAIR
ncbi:MAG: FIG00687856: Predicted nucleotidyltransferases [uncultured Sphingomonas sp.]|uniref:FIG00687856: Predicted nucleotidyltransferases n=1 Tax=uncultured Sphingomonas sp. TaxID=158754 RepID=A0A6J4TDM6_9SPHN|nr:MAG: FIG00687856: Predicted nucleotidyltransferases [uncultured Sphingomonas sp.]